MYETKYVLLPLAAVAFFVIVVGILTQNLQKAPRLFKTRRPPPPGKTEIVVNDKRIYVDVADSPSEWQTGLSDRKSLNENEGLLFIFDKKDTIPAFWMKNMLFAIDIIWIDDGKIIQIHQNVPNPEPSEVASEFPLYKPYVPIDYVLEVNAGFVKKHGIAVRDPVDLSATDLSN